MAWRHRQVQPLLLSLLLLQLHPTRCSSDPLGQCSGRREAPLCLVTGTLRGACPPEATGIVLGFSGTGASWQADGGLRECGSVGHLKVTGWSGPELLGGHLRQLASLSSVDIVDGGLETVGASVSTNSLVDISLARNRISSIHELSLAECRGLHSLDLSDNTLDHLPDRWLVNCRSLRTLRLNGNRLSELRPEALLGATDLRELQMQKNRFQLLHNVELSFINSGRLSLIDLRSNGLFSYLPGRRGFCGPANATVRMHFSGCAPSPDSWCGPAAVRHECVGRSAHLIVTFTSCQVAVGGDGSRCPAVPTPPAALARPICEVAALPAAAVSVTPGHSPGSSTDRIGRQLLSHLGFGADGGAWWLLCALAATVAFALLQLIVSLAVCHRLKLRIARLQVRAERLAEECPSHHRYFQHPCSQSALSGRLTPSGKGPSSHCGFSHFEEEEARPPPLSMPRTLDEATGAEEPLRMQEDE